MSIVRYRGSGPGSPDPGEIDDRAIVLRNLQQKSIVLYDKDTNSIDIVDSEFYFKNYGSRSSKSNGNDNDNVNTDESRKGNGDSRSSDFVCPNCGFGSKKTSNIGDMVLGHSGEDGDDTGPDGSEFISSDYFKVLAASEYENKEQEKLLEMIKRSRRMLIPDDSKTLSWVQGYDLGDANEGGVPSSVEDTSTESVEGSDQFDESSLFGDLPPNLFTQGYFNKFFKRLKVLGNGSNGKVLKVEHVLHDLPLGIFALKKIAIGNHLSNLETILQEVKLLYQLTESTTFLDDSMSGGIGGDLRRGSIGTSIENGINNLIKYNHVWLEIDKVSDFGPKVPCVFILFEYCDGGTVEELVDELMNPKLDLLEEKKYRRMKRQMKNFITNGLLRQKRYLNNYEIFKIFKDIVSGVLYLHRSHILHRDLKPSNCLFKQNFASELKYESPITSIGDFDRLPTVVVSDFGEGVMEGMKRNSTGATGTIEFLAPELYNTNVEFSTKSDIYSLGMILYYLCFGKLPYSSNSPMTIKSETQRGLFQDIDDIRPIAKSSNDQGKLLSSYIYLIKSMTNVDIEMRPTCEEVMLMLDDILMELDTSNSGSEIEMEMETEAGWVNEGLWRNEYWLLGMGYVIAALIYKVNELNRVVDYLDIFLMGCLTFADHDTRFDIVITLIVVLAVTSLLSIT